MQAAGNSIRQCGGKPSRKREKKRAHLVLHGDAEGHRRDPGAKGQRTDLTRLGKSGSSGDTQEDSRGTEALRTECMCEIRKQMEEKGPIRAAVGITGNGAGRITQQDEDKDPRLYPARPRTLQRCTAGKSSSRKPGERAARCMPDRDRKRKRRQRERRRWRKQSKRAVGQAAGKMEEEAIMCLGASNCKRRTRIGADRIFDECGPRVQLKVFGFSLLIVVLLSGRGFSFLNTAYVALVSHGNSMILKEKNPWITPTESCASDETEEAEMKPFRATPVLSDPFTEEVKIRYPRPESHRCQTGVNAKVVSHLHPRYRQVDEAD